MTPDNKKESKDPGEWIIGGILFGVFILLGVAIEWLGWWTVLIAILILLFVWNWRWALVIILPLLWACIDFSLSL